MDKLTVNDVDFKDKKVIVRADFNVPLDDDLNITDDIRIRAAVPTIKKILEQNPKKVILMSHLGRPKGEVVDSMRLNPVAECLSGLLNEDVFKLDDCVGEEVHEEIKNGSNRIVLLENLRFHKEETDNVPKFSKELASYADVFVNDAFGTAHRAHASTEGIAKHLPSMAGLLLEEEVKYLGKAVNNPQKPFVVILGGAKVSDKILLVENLLDKADSILIGGGMAYTFLKAQGVSIGDSICEEDKIDVAKDILNKAKEKGVAIEITEDFVIVDDFDNTASKKISDTIPDGWEGLDIGPKTREKFKSVLADAKTVIWNGPMGVFERDEFAEGSQEIAQHLAELSDTTVIISGGDSAAAVKKFNLSDKMTHISTGGGASLALLEGKELPGIAALTNNEEKVGA